MTKKTKITKKLEMTKKSKMTTTKNEQKIKYKI